MSVSQNNNIMIPSNLFAHEIAEFLCAHPVYQTIHDDNESYAMIFVDATSIYSCNIGSNQEVIFITKTDLSSLNKNDQDKEFIAKTMFTSQAVLKNIQFWFYGYTDSSMLDMKSYIKKLDE